MSFEDRLAATESLYREYNRVHREVFSFRALLPIPLYFRRLDFAALAHRLARVRDGLAAAAPAMREELKLEPPWSRKPFALLVEYRDALDDTTEKFHEMLESYDDVIKRGKSFPWFGRDHVTSCYLAARQLCRRLRARLLAIDVEGAR